MLWVDSMTHGTFFGENSLLLQIKYIITTAIASSSLSTNRQYWLQIMCHILASFGWCTCKSSYPDCKLIYKFQAWRLWSFTVLDCQGVYFLPLCYPVICLKNLNNGLILTNFARNIKYLIAVIFYHRLCFFFWYIS